ncbi:MAG: O-antigen ligase family protein [Chitinophagaceae bacterium]|nr:O-antigen ligase family protein [Chitinophagaceae bacterium]
MKQLFLINDTIANKISYYHLALFLIALPFDFFYSELILISFGLHTFIHVRKDDWQRVFSKPVLIQASLFLLGLLAISYSSDKSEGFNVTTRQLAILIFPVLFALAPLDMEKYKMDLFCIFGLTCVATVLYLYADAVRTVVYFHLPVSSLFTTVFMNHNFSLPIGIHATYLSVYIVFSLLVFLYLLLKNERPKQKWICILSSVILFAGLIQLSSRAAFIAFLMVINLAFPFLLFKGKKRIAFFIAASLVSAGTLLIIVNVDSFKTRYISELKTDLTNDVKIIENSEPRLARWNAITELVNASPVIGYGTGAEKKLLKEKYFEKGLYISYLNEFNTHSEYLGVLLKTGMVGLLLFLYILYFGFATAIQNRDLLFLSFMMIIAIVSVSENILDLNKGIFFYSFFFSFFLCKTKYALLKELTPAAVNTGNQPILKSV